MPHDPFFYDGNSQLRGAAAMRKDRIDPAPAYLGYLTHVNIEIKKLIDTIQQNTSNKAVI